jgi:hypothetical protein
VGFPEFDIDDADAAAYCPACGAGYTAGPTHCADCDVELRPRSEIEALRAMNGEAPAISGGAFTSPLPGPPDLEENLEFDLSDPDAVAYCPSCGSGFRAGPVRCVDCDRDLMPRAWAEAQACEPALEHQTLDALVPLADVENPFRADVLGSVLNAERIWFTTKSTGWAAIRFVVRSRDLEAARQILSDMDEMADRAEES